MNARSNTTVALIAALVAFALASTSLALTFYGLWLAFSASVLLGVLALLVAPSPFVFGLVKVVADKDLAQMAAAWLGI